MRYVLMICSDESSVAALSPEEGQAMLADSDIQEFYLGVGETGHHSYRDLKSYRRRKRWTA